MVKKAFFRANIPFSFDNKIIEDNEFFNLTVNKGWEIFDVEGDFLLKHINTTFEKNVVALRKQCDGLTFTLPFCDTSEGTETKTYLFEISEMDIFCFSTGIGIISMYIPYTDAEANALVNTCSVLRCCAQHKDPSQGRCVYKNDEETYLSVLAENELDLIFGKDCSLFNHFNENTLRRIDMFSAVLLDENENQDEYDKICYRLANAFDNRDKDIKINPKDFYRQQEYTRWSFSKRGCSAVANLTGLNITDSFLENRWFVSVNTNYFYLYIMVLHQKYAIYNYLNEVAIDSDKNYVKLNQESLIEFNSKYIFSIVSDEHFIQSVYLRMKEVNNVDEVYEDLQDELKRLFEYSQLENDKNTEMRNSRLNIISIFISILCSVPIIFETFNMFSDKRSLLCISTIAIEILLILTALTSIFIITKRKK